MNSLLRQVQAVKKQEVPEGEQAKKKIIWMEMGMSQWR